MSVILNMHSLMPAKRVKNAPMRWGMAILLAVGLHLGLMLAFGLSSKPDLTIEGFEGQGTLANTGAEMAMDVSLVEAAPMVPAISTKTPLFDKFRALNSEPSSVTPLAASRPAQSLAQALGESAEPSKTSPRNAPSPDLWKAIEPCWQRVADKDTVPVTLEITFSPLGNLARPPVIKRAPGAALSDDLLRSESQALAALSQCGPYLMAFGQSGVAVTFPKGG